MTAEALATFAPHLKPAVEWLVATNPERLIIPQLRDRFGLSALEAIAALRLAREIREGRGQ